MDFLLKCMCQNLWVSVFVHLDLLYNFYWNLAKHALIFNRDEKIMKNEKKTQKKKNNTNSI